MSDLDEKIPPIEEEPPAAPKAAPIGHLAIRGVIWSTALTLGTKVISVLQQFIIAKYFLSDEDFGLVAMSQVVISLASIGQNLGLSEIMARRHRTFQRWAQAAIWMSFAGALVCVSLILAMLPFWDTVFTHVSAALSGKSQPAPHIQGLLAIWCLGLPFDAMTGIFNSRLRADLRFRAWATISTIQTLSIAILSVVLAMLHLGAYALVIPVPFMMIVICLLSHHLSRQRVRMRLQLSRWLPLLRDARYFFTGNVFNVLLQQGDYLLTGLFFKQALLGAYYFAFRTSSQTGQLISANLATILVPSFARLDQERTRQIAAYERACAVLLLIGIPVCLLQSLLAQPMFHLLFGAKWEDAAPLFQTLSIAMGFAIPMSTAGSLLVAQDRFRINMILTCSQAILFVSFVFTGGLCGSVVWVARFVALFYIIFGPLTVALPVWISGGSPARFIARTHWFPVLAGGAAAIAAWTIPWLLHVQGDILTILFRTAIWLVVVATLLWVVRPPAARELAPRITALLARILPFARRP